MNRIICFVGVLLFSFLTASASNYSVPVLNNITDLYNFSTDVNWSDSYIDSELIEHYYSWHSSKSSVEQNKEINDPVYFGLPPEVILHPGCGPVQWVYFHPIGPQYEVILENKSYSNSTELVYLLGYLPTPKKNINRITIDSVTNSPVEYIINDDTVIVKTTITVDYHKRTKRKTQPGFKKEYFVCSVDLINQYNVSLWPKMENINYTVDATLINHSRRYTTLHIQIPANLSYYKLVVESQNHTGYFTKTNYVYYELFNNSYYMELFDFIDDDGMRPYGTNVFLLPFDQEYTVQLYTGTPFEKVKIGVNVTHENKKKEKRGFNQVYFGALVSMITAFIILWRSFNGLN